MLDYSVYARDESDRFRMSKKEVGLTREELDMKVQSKPQTHSLSSCIADLKRRTSCSLLIYSLWISNNCSGMSVNS